MINTTNLNLFVAFVLLAYPLFSLPILIKSKKVTGKYFSDSRLFVSKQEGNGTNFNMHNPISFFLLLIVGLALLVYSI